ncbi:hypothetical protein B0H14DRAFT_3489170 [Mycena olivaceomarginata]|nr:hypothetical protein B0H14DRAFT_3489170 [Mycena olivaceomarginata]
MGYCDLERPQASPPLYPFAVASNLVASMYSAMLLPYTVIISALASVVSVKAVPAPKSSVSTPAPVPVVSDAAEIASGLNTEASVVDCLTKLLTDSNGTLLTGESLRQLTVLYTPSLCNQLD